MPGRAKSEAVKHLAAVHEAERVQQRAKDAYLTELEQYVQGSGK